MGAKNNFEKKNIGVSELNISDHTKINLSICKSCTLYTPGFKTFVGSDGPLNAQLMKIGEAPGCFLSGTPIFTNSKTYNIEDPINDYMFTDDLKYRVENYPIIRFKVNKFPEYSCTFEHKILVRTRQKLSKTKLPKGLSKPKWIKAFKLLKLLKDGYQIFVMVPKEKYYNGFLQYLNIIQYSNFNSRRKTDKKIPHTLIIDKEIAFLFGCYMGDGNTDFKGGGIHIHLSEGFKEKYVSIIKNILESRFNLKVYIKHVNKRITISIYARTLTTLFLKLFGKNCYEKRIPELIMKSSPVIISEFLRGWYVTDGGHYSNSIKGQTITSVSKLAIYDGVLAGLKCGVLLGVRHEKTRRQNEVDCCKLTIDNKSMLKLGWINKPNHIINPMYGEDKNNFYLKINKANFDNYTGLVYDKTTRNHVYQIPFIVHNSTEVKRGIPFCGKAGIEDTRYSKENGIYRNNTYITNICKCRPPENRDPTEHEIKCCSYILKQELAAVKTQVIACLGRIAAKWFLGPYIDMEAIHGIPFWCEFLPDSTSIGHRIIVPMYHPAYGLHDPRNMIFVDSDYKSLGQVIYKNEIPRKLGYNAGKYNEYKEIKEIKDLSEVFSCYYR